MNSYFDDPVSTNAAATSTTTATTDDSASTIDKSEIDSDLSKLFGKAEKPADSTTSITSPAPAPTPVFTPMSTVAGALDTKPGKIEESSSMFEKDKPAISSATSSGSLADIESKLKSKKDDFAKQITELQDKQKKVDETLEKIKGLKTQEDEILKAAQEL